MYTDYEQCTMSQHSLGLDPKRLSDVINKASGRCWSSDTYNPCPGVLEGVPSNNDYQGGFKTGLMAKVVAIYNSKVQAPHTHTHTHTHTVF